ncbi:MAG TPA: TetR/AcrR family transcriptional regulator [Streptosporangiaceae bacterium]|nr:TetR/AcrR family transcriptional regulator [Streptosporangiaceae bacterium]
MAGARGNAVVRREPTQQRSRQRVEQILDAAADLIVEQGVEGLSTRTIAARAGTPVASLYQYFADKNEIILALVQRDTAEMDERVAEAVASLDRPSVRSLVEATMRAFVAVYHRRPAFVVIWWRGRTNAAVYRYCREHNRRIARQLHDFAVAAGLVPAWTEPIVAELAVEVGDRLFQLAFEDDLRGDSRIIAEGIELVTGYLERYASASVRESLP